jgi:hypothetical protein
LPVEFAPRHLFVVLDLVDDLVISEAGEGLEGPWPERIRSVDVEALAEGVDVAGDPVIATLPVDGGRTGPQRGHMVLGTLDVGELSAFALSRSPTFN